MQRARTTVQPKKRGIAPGFLGKLGPGLVTGAADDDPSGISTYSVAVGQRVKENGAHRAYDAARQALFDLAGWGT